MTTPSITNPLQLPPTDTDALERALYDEFEVDDASTLLPRVRRHTNDPELGHVLARYLDYRVAEACGLVDINAIAEAGDTAYRVFSVYETATEDETVTLLQLMSDYLDWPFRFGGDDSGPEPEPRSLAEKLKLGLLDLAKDFEAGGDSDRAQGIRDWVQVQEVGLAKP
jgi:hypothetical protein